MLLSQFHVFILFVVEETTGEIKQTKREGRKEVRSHEKESRESSQESGQRSQESGKRSQESGKGSQESGKIRPISISAKIIKEFSNKERLMSILTNKAFLYNIFILY